MSEHHDPDTNPRLWYYPNPAHKKGTTEAGPPEWYPAKTACPDTMTLEERDQLVAESLPLSEDPLDPSRIAVRRVEGRLEWYRTMQTRRHPDGRIEIHGHPFEPGYPKIPPAVLRRMRDSGLITAREYTRLVKS